MLHPTEWNLTLLRLEDLAQQQNSRDPSAMASQAAQDEEIDEQRRERARQVQAGDESGSENMIRKDREGRQEAGGRNRSGHGGREDEEGAEGDSHLDFYA
ncbi:MAG: hypothetical protein K9L28_04080 [Synergistales bacterium]|nr:hypothetical protein [Synergistales bacterium]